MHKRNLALVIISFLALTVFFTGCDFNLFSAIDRPSLPSASDIEGRTIDSDADAQSFLSDVEDWQDGDVLSGDPDAAKAVVAKLEEVYDPASGFETETRQEAAVLAGEVAFTSNEDVAELEDNVLTTMMNVDDTTDPETILNDLIPEDITEEDFNDMISSMLDARAAYDAYGGTLEADGSGSELDLTDGDTGTIAQRALISGIVYHTVDSLGSGDTEAGTEELYKLINGELDDTSSLDNLMDNFDPETSSDPNLINIMEAAGMADMF